MVLLPGLEAERLPGRRLGEACLAQDPAVAVGERLEGAVVVDEELVGDARQLAVEAALAAAGFLSLQ